MVLVRVESETNWDYGFNPYNRPLKHYLSLGFVNLDKPSGPTSHDVSDWVKKLLGVSKAGHTGTLDPKVTGVLPVLLGKSTKLVEFLIKSGKEYVCLAYLHKEVDSETVRSVLESFKGEIKQMVPRRASVKRRVRKRTVHDLKVLEVDGRNVLFWVETQAGTYIRKLVHDFGELLGCGAHMKELRRVRAGSFVESDSFRVDELLFAKDYYDREGDDRYLRMVVRPVEEALPGWKSVWLLDSAVHNVCNGSPLYVKGVSKVSEGVEKGEWVKLLTLKNELIGVGVSHMSSEEMVSAEKGVSVTVKKVVMSLNTYPKF